LSALTTFKLKASGLDGERPPPERYARGLESLHKAFKAARGVALHPPPALSLSAWAEEYAFLSPETSSEAGKFHAFGYQRGILDAITDPDTQQITVMKSARVGYTKCLDHVLGYYIHQDPSPVLMVQPRIEDAEDYSRTEVAPMLRDTPVLAEIAGHIKQHDPRQRLAKRVFRNGASVAFVGANSPAGFRRITARIVCFDEIDGYPPEGAGKEGDQIALGIKRSETFWNRKIILGSTPTFKDTSRIERAYEASDKRRYYVACPQCGHGQTLRWENLRWDRSANGGHLPDTAHFVCEQSGCIIEEKHKQQMIGGGEWRAAAPFKGHAGFHIWAAYSLWPNACWANLVRDFLRARKDPIMLRTFVNTILGETWEETAETVDGHALLGRGENYGPDSIPKQVRFLTAGVDTQGDRLEIQVVGWAADEESFVVDYEILVGDPAQARVWSDLDALLLRPYHDEERRELRIQSVCVDALGHHSNQVQMFCDARRPRRVFAIGGRPGAHPIWPKRPSDTKQHKKLWLIGVDTAKDVLYGRLRIASKGPGYIHFPAGNTFNSTYFEQLTSERVVTQFRLGRPQRKWELPSGKRNEALDTYVYALAARMSMPSRLDFSEPAVPAHPAQVELREIEQARPNEDVHSHAAEIAAQAPRIVHEAWERPGWLPRRGRGWFEKD
jgi:phage terminase large subunit GpA-like protein